MQRTKLADRNLPNYTKGEECFHMVSHIVGAVLGIVATVLCVVVAAKNSNVYGVVSGAIFGAMMMALYTISSVYHGLSPNIMAKRVMQILDHCTIFMLIAGTYTPIALCLIREYNVALGWTVFGVVWAAAIVGITLNAIDLKKFKKFSIICYLAMGWCIIGIADKIFLLFGTGGVVLLLAGGVSYTIGAVLYVMGSKRKYFHGVFHVFTVIGSLCHFLCVLLYVL